MSNTLCRPPTRRHLIPSVVAWLTTCCLLAPAASLAQGFSGRLLDAVKLTLEHESSLAAARQKIISDEGALLSARAPFDPVWNAGVTSQRNFTPLNTASGGGSIEQSQTVYQAGLSQRLESGVVINPTLNVTRLRDTGVNRIPQSSSNLALKLVIPLLRGRGTRVNLAGVSAAELSLQAARLDYRHTLSASILRTTSAYWDLVAARHSVVLARVALDRASASQSNARRLADAGEIPRADLLKYRAQQLSQVTRLVSAEQQVVQAGLALAKAMNLPSGQLAADTVELQEFPTLEELGPSLAGRLQALLPLIGQDLRADVRAARERARAAQVLADGLQRDSAQQLDLTFSVGYNGLREGQSALGSVGALGPWGRGPNVSLSLNYTLPVSNQDRRGLISQREAAAEQARLSYEAMQLSAQGEAHEQLQALSAAVAALQTAREQKALQTSVYENERKAYQAGLSTLLDLFTAETQLTSTETDLVLASRNLAQALVRFRFQIVRLVPEDVDSFTLDTRTLLTLPEHAP